MFSINCTISSWYFKIDHCWTITGEHLHSVVMLAFKQRVLFGFPDRVDSPFLSLSFDAAVASASSSHIAFALSRVNLLSRLVVVATFQCSLSPLPKIFLHLQTFHIFLLLLSFSWTDFLVLWLTFSRYDLCCCGLPPLGLFERGLVIWSPKQLLFLLKPLVVIIRQTKFAVCSRTSRLFGQSKPPTRLFSNILL